MSLHKTSNITFREKCDLVEKYLKTGQSLRKIAHVSGISYKTLWFWVKLYKEGGKENLGKRKLHKKKLSKDIEKKVMLSKEHNPALSLRKARQLMNKKGIQISNKGIWSIWKKYGFVGRRKQLSLGVFAHPTPQLEYTIEMSNALVEIEDYKGAAKILNKIPCLPKCPLLLRIPEKFLSSRRRLERLHLEYGHIPFQQLLRKARQLGNSMETKGYIYSSIIANFLELDALGWLGEPEKRINVLDRLAVKIRKIRDSGLWFFFYYEQGSSFAHLLQISRSLELIKKCRKFIYRLPRCSYYWEPFGDLLTYVGKYKHAFWVYKMLFENEKNPETVKRLALKMAIFGHAYAGRYSECKKMLILTRSLKNSLNFASTYNIGSAYVSFAQGNLADASQLFVMSLEKAHKNKIHNHIYAASVGLSAVAMALNKKSEARIYLQKYLPLLKKHKLKLEELVLKCLINSAVNISDEFIQIPSLCLLNYLLQAKGTMKIGDYRKALNYALRHEIMGVFHRWIVFFPEVVLHLLEKGKLTALPKAILKFPIFNKDAPVYNMNIVGTLIVYKNQEYLRVKLKPKDTAFLIHLALRAGEPENEISLEDLYKNFWRNSKNPARNLSHLLVRVKNTINLPSHLLEVSSKKDNPVLINKGIHFITDYDEYKQSLAQAKALLRAGEWGFAKREYIRAFKLFRGEPFKKMYDDWSDDKRLEILFSYEKEVKAFTDELRKRGRNEEAERLLKKAEKIVVS